MIDVLFRIFIGACMLAALVGAILGFTYLVTISIDNIFLIILGIFFLVCCYTVGDIIMDQ
jgi:hypothetical protein